MAESVHWVAPRRASWLHYGRIIGACIVTAGCVGFWSNPAHLFKPQPGVEWRRLVPLPAGETPPERYDEDEYEDRFEEVRVALRVPPCSWIRGWVGEGGGPILVLLPGIESDRWEWFRTLPILEGLKPAAMFMVRWSPYEKLDTLVAAIASGASRLAQCTAGRAGPLVVIAHSAGGVLASFAASRIILPPPANQRHAYVVTIASPLAGAGNREPHGEDEVERAFLLDLGVGFYEYPPAAPGVRAIHLRTHYPADPEMKPSGGGHLPNRPGVGIPGAVEVDLPDHYGHNNALIEVVSHIGDGSWVPWRNFDDARAVLGSDVDIPLPATPKVCKLREEILDAGDPFIVPSYDDPPVAQRLEYWDGATLPISPPSPDTYVRCRPCNCRGGRIQPWSEWQGINAGAYARLRTAHVPYPVAIIPGYYSESVMRHRLEAGVTLLDLGWVGALIVSGGHRRTGHSYAREMLELAAEIAADEEIDIEDRIFVEPCAEHTTTNLRNGLRMMAAFGLRYGLLVTDAKMSFQASVFQNQLEERVPEELGCDVGRVSYLWGDGTEARIGADATGCRPYLTWRNTLIGFFFSTRRPATFWVSPVSWRGAMERSAIDCRGGAPRIVAVEPDSADAWHSECLPQVGESTLVCD